MSNMSEADIDVQDGVLLEAFTPGYGPCGSVPLREERRGASQTRSAAEIASVDACKFLANAYGHEEFSIDIESTDDPVNGWDWTVRALKFVDIYDGSDE